jgi:hypothetical protein
MGFRVQKIKQKMNTKVILMFSDGFFFIHLNKTLFKFVSQTL